VVEHAQQLPLLAEKVTSFWVMLGMRPPGYRRAPRCPAVGSPRSGGGAPELISAKVWPSAAHDRQPCTALGPKVGPTLGPSHTRRPWLASVKTCGAGAVAAIAHNAGFRVSNWGWACTSDVTSRRPGGPSGHGGQGVSASRACRRGGCGAACGRTSRPSRWSCARCGWRARSRAPSRRGR